MPDIDKVIFVSLKDANDQVRNTRSKVAVTLDIAALPCSDIDSKIMSIDLSIAYLLRLRAQLITERLLRRVKSCLEVKLW